MNQTSGVSLDPAALAAFAGSLVHLPEQEVRKAKTIFLLNAVADFKAQRATGRVMVIIFGVMSIIPVFLVVFIPAMVIYMKTMGAAREKILNAATIWHDDIGDDCYREIIDRLGG